MSGAHAAPLDRRGLARIHEPADFDRAHLCPSPLGHGRGRASQLFAHLIYAAIVILAAMIAGDPWIQIVLVSLVVPLLAAIKGALRTIAAAELLPEWKKQINEWSWAWPALAPIVPFLFSWNFISSLLHQTDSLAQCALRIGVSQRDARPQPLAPAFS